MAQAQALGHGDKSCELSFEMFRHQFPLLDKRVEVYLTSREDMVRGGGGRSAMCHP